MSTQIHLIDFSKDGEEAYEKLASVCQGLDIGVLGELWYEFRQQFIYAC
jgi:hypothetical protein